MCDVKIGKKKYFFREADLNDEKQILDLYASAIGTEGCTWSEDYPSRKTFESDVNRQDIFCMVNENDEIVGAISVDKDDEVDSLKCWNKAAGKMGELARLVVREDCRNKGMAPELIRRTIEVLKERKYKTVHYLVSKYNERALASYRKLSFTKVGESDILHNEWYCYEYVIEDEEEKNHRIFTIPNVLSFIRLILAGLFFVLYSGSASISDNIWAIVVLIASGITDFLDGKIARKYHMISELGKILDPVADKVTEGVIAICLVEKYRMLLILLAVFIVKELFMSICGVIIVKKTGKNKGAKWYGKVSTFTFYIIMIALLIIPNIPIRIANVLIILCTVTMAFAFVMYARRYYLLYTGKITE